MTDVTSPHIRVLQQHIQQSAAQLEQYNVASETNTDSGMGSLIYLGNHQDAVPRELIIDPILNSGEIHTWMLMKIHVVNPTTPCSIPSRQDLIDTLKCSRPVLSRHMQVLRALRWVTLCHEVRGKNGQFKGSVYAQHDRPLSLQDTLYLDPSYLEFLEQDSRGTVLERLRQIKNGVLKHIDYQVENGAPLDQKTTQLDQASAGLTLSGKDPLDTHLACLKEVIDPLNCINMYSDPSKDDIEATSKTSAETQLQETGHRIKNIDTVDHVNIYMAGKDKKNRKKHEENTIENLKSPPQRIISHVKNIDMAISGGSGNNIYNTKNKNNNVIKTTTTTGNLRFPKTLQKSDRQKRYALKQLKLLGVPENDYQYILDYLTDRIKAGEQGTEKPVINPIGLLGWIARNHVARTLPPSSYGIRDDKARNQSSAKLSEEEKILKKQQDIEAWARSMENMGITVDRETQTIVRKK